MSPHYYFYYHQVYDGSTKYAVICTNIGKLAGNPATVDVPLDYVGGLESIKNSSGDTISAAQVELLKNLLTINPNSKDKNINKGKDKDIKPPESGDSSPKDKLYFFADID